MYGIFLAFFFEECISVLMFIALVFIVWNNVYGVDVGVDLVHSLDVDDVDDVDDVGVVVGIRLWC